MSANILAVVAASTTSCEKSQDRHLVQEQPYPSLAPINAFLAQPTSAKINT